MNDVMSIFFDFSKEFLLEMCSPCVVGLLGNTSIFIYR